MAAVYSPSEYTWLREEAEKILNGVGDYMGALGALIEKASNRSLCSQESYDLLILWLKRHRIGPHEIKAALNVHRGLVPSSLYFMNVDIKKLSVLPIEVQRDIASGKKYDVMMPDGSLEMLDFTEMSNPQRNQVIGTDGIIPFAEQKVPGATKKDKKIKVLQKAKFALTDDSEQVLSFTKNDLRCEITLDDLAVSLVDEGTVDEFLKQFEVSVANVMASIAMKKAAFDKAKV